jgi:hypothetical protein
MTSQGQKITWSHPARASRGLIRSQVFDLVIIGPGPVHVDVDMHSLTTVHFTAALRMN